MTTEQKARAYDEALERARKQRDDYQKELDKTDKSSQLAGILRAGICAIELAFPELKESEDERIRKAILGLTYIDGIEPILTKCSITAQDIRTYLEKQKESLHISETCKDVILAIKKYLDWLTGYPDYSPKGKYSIQDMLHCLYVIEKQKEKKSEIEIRPLYKENGYYPIEDCDYGLEIASDILEKTLGEVRGYQTDDGIREHQTAIEAVRKAKEQKPAEWNEEDAMLMDELESYILYDKEFNDEQKSWRIKRLKSFRPQPHCKISNELDTDTLRDWSMRFAPDIREAIESTAYHFYNISPQSKQEWSDEDKAILEWCIADIERAKSHPSQTKPELCDIEINWLKSLHPKVIKWDNVMINTRTDIMNKLREKGDCPCGWFTYLENCGPRTKYAYWRPSEKQIKALQCAVVFMEIRKASDYDISTLKSLYNDLMELM